MGQKALRWTGYQRIISLKAGLSTKLCIDHAKLSGFTKERMSMPETENKTRHLNCFLVKEEYTEYADIMRDDVNYSEYSIRDDMDTSGLICVGSKSEKKPKWVELLDEATSTSIGELLNTSNRAVVFIQEKERIFAFTFGYGRYLMRDESLVYNFGFRTVINAVDPRKLKSIDVANLEELTVHSRIQTSTDSAKESFGVDILNDLIRSVTGTPRNGRLAKVITGRDSVAFSDKMNFKGLRTKCRLLLHEYRSEKYKEDFDWIDNLYEERDKTKIGRLNDNLIADIKARNSTKMHLAPTEAIDWEEFAGFNYVKYGKDEDFFPTLSIEDYISKIDDLQGLDFETFKKHRLFTHHATTDEKFGRWKIWRCLTYETELLDEVTGTPDKYVFTLGRWYCIDKGFVDTIVNYVEGLPSSDIPFIECDVRTEGEYNKKLADCSPDYYLLDKINVKCESARTVIEPCDILTNRLQFIHIKQKHNSANLSHLFAQGRISSESLIKDPTFKGSIKSKALEKRNYSLDFIDDGRDISASDCDIVFAIIDPAADPLHKSLPFFSLLNLRQTSMALRLIGFNVYVNKIPKTYQST
jgi:uncharacterized protein (TIGR04141 family)